MSSNNVCEDAGVFIQAEYETQEIRRRNSSASSTVRTFQQREERRRTSSVRSKHPPEDNDANIVISPEDIPDEYENNENYPGLFLLFNHEEFATHDSREGTNKDQNDLIDCLSRLRYEVRRDLLCKNYTKSQIEEELNKVVQMDHTKRSSLIVVFLTHGDEDGKLYSSDGNFITCQDLWNLFAADKCPTLKGKPKIFIFQACKGKSKSRVAEVQVDSVRRVDIAKKQYTIPTEADILVAYSTFEGNVSYRNSADGSWYIQELCYNFSTYGRRDDIVTIFTRISKCVAYHYQHKNYKQMPCFISTLTRKFYLCKSRERGYFLELREHNKNLLQTVEKMQKQIGALEKKVEESKAQNNGQTASTSRPFRQISNTRKTSLTDKPRWKN